MSIPIFDSYKNLHFRSTRDPRKKKTIGYFLDKSKSIYSTFLSGYGSLTQYDIDEILHLRQVARNETPESKFKEYFSLGVLDIDGVTLDKASGFYINNMEGERKGFLNVNWQVVSPAKTLTDNLVSILEQEEYNISCDPTDPISKDLAEDQKLRMITIRNNMKFINQIESLIGLEIDKPESIPETDEEIELLDKMGGFKPAFAQYMEVLLQHTEDISDFKEIAAKCKRDVIENNRFVFREKYNPETSKIEYEYIDIARFLSPWSVYNDHRDASYGAHWYEMSISELYQWFPKESQEFFSNIANTYCGKLGNPESFELYNIIDNSTGHWGYDSWKVAVLHTEWIDIDSRKFETATINGGRTKTKEVDYDKEVNVKDKIVNFSDKRFRFECEWLIGQDVAFNYGKVYTTRSSPKDACLTYHHYKLDGQSKIKLAEPFFDDFMIIWVKLQNIFAYASNDFKFINMRKLMSGVNNPKDDGGKAEKLAMKKLIETSFAFFDNSGIGGLPADQNAPAMEQYPGGMGTLFQECILKIELNSKLIETVTGINPIVLGYAPKSEDPVTTNMAAVQATSNTLRPSANAWFTMRKKGAEGSARFMQILIETNPESRKAYEPVIDRFGIDTIVSSMSDRRHANSTIDFGITMNLRPNKLQREEILKASTAAMIPNRDGQTLWTLPDHLLITDMIDSGKSLKMIWWVFATMQERNRKRAAKETAKTQEAINIATQQQNEQKAKFEKELAEDTHKKKLELLKAEKELELAKVSVQENIRKDKEIEKEKLKHSEEVNKYEKQETQ